MYSLERLLSAAEKNTHFIMLLESGLTKLQATINRNIGNYISLFHETSPKPNFSINPIQCTITICLGEINYIISIKKVKSRLKEENTINITDVEQALIAEIECVIEDYFLS